MSAKWDGLHVHELPIVPCMVHPSYTDGFEFTETMLDKLRARTRIDASARWAIETITELQRLWFESADKLQEIEAIIQRGSGHE